MALTEETRGSQTKANMQNGQCSGEHGHAADSNGMCRPNAPPQKEPIPAVLTESKPAHEPVTKSEHVNPGPDNEMEQEELIRLIATYFHRYDLDESGTLDSEELSQLATNLSFKLRLPLTGEEIDVLVNSVGVLENDDAWDLHDFTQWFKAKFLQSHCGTTIGGSMHVQGAEAQQKLDSFEVAADGEACGIRINREEKQGMCQECQVPAEE